MVLKASSGVSWGARVLRPEWDTDSHGGVCARYDGAVAPDGDYGMSGRRYVGRGRSREEVEVSVKSERS